MVQWLKRQSSSVPWTYATFLHEPIDLLYGSATAQLDLPVIQSTRYKMVHQPPNHPVDLATATLSSGSNSVKSAMDVVISSPYSPLIFFTERISDTGSTAGRFLVCSTGVEVRKIVTSSMCLVICRLGVTLRDLILDEAGVLPKTRAALGGVSKETRFPVPTSVNALWSGRLPTRAGLLTDLMGVFLADTLGGVLPVALAGVFFVPLVGVFFLPLVGVFLATAVELADLLGVFEVGDERLAADLGGDFDFVEVIGLFAADLMFFLGVTAPVGVLIAGVLGESTTGFLIGVFG